MRLLLQIANLGTIKWVGPRNSDFDVKPNVFFKERTIK